MTGIRSVDEQLTEIAERRATAMSLLCRCLIEIDAMSARIDVLLDRLWEQQAADQPERMT